MQKLLLGQLPVAEVERLAVEYADDVRLAELAESLSGKDDTLLNSLRTLDTVADPGDERLTERLLERLQLAQLVQPPRPAHPRDEAAIPQQRETPSGASSPAAVPAVPALPARLEHYRPIKVLGQGGMGTVYLVEDTRLGRECAVKTLRSELAVNRQARARFLSEAHTAATLEHDHIVPIHYVGEADGIPFLAMPLLKGETLDALLRRTAGPLPAAQAIRIAREAACGLAAAHEHGLIHRDIKPTNIWLEAPRGRVRILDFGLAKAAGPGSGIEADPHLTATGAIVGTPAYMAPEQASGHPLDARSDLFSLGCVLYEMVAGERPFLGANTMSVLTSLAVHTPAAPHLVNPSCPVALSRLVMQLLEKAPAARPASAEKVIQALDELEAAPAASAITVPAVPAPRKAGTDACKADTITLPTSTVPVPGPAPRRHRLRFIAAVLLLGGLLAAGAGMLAVIHISTDEGDYVIETDDPDFSFKVSKGTVILEDAKAKRKYHLKVVKQDKGKGQFDLEVTDKDAGLVFNTPTFTIKRGEKFALRATFQPKPADVAQSATTDPDRKAAAYVLSIGGTVHVNEQERDFKAVTDLPRGSFRLTFVSLRGNKRLRDAGLAPFRDCKNIMHLDLINTQVSDADLAHFKECKNLTWLGLSDTQVSEAGLAHFKECKNLTTLWLAGTQVSDADLAHFKDCKNLTHLGLDGTQVTDGGLAHFKDCKNLMWLALPRTKVSETGLAHFKECKNLTVLVLGYTQVSEAGLAHFKECKNLTQLWLDGTPVTDGGLAHFKDRRNLTQLSLNGTQVSDTGLAYFKDCKNLTYLSLYDAQVSDTGLAHFKDCTDLKWLFLSGTKVSDDGLAPFRDCKNLTQLWLRGTKVSDTGLAPFRDCKNLTSLVLQKTEVTAAGIDELKKALPQCRIEWDGGVIEPTTSPEPDRKAAAYVLSIGGTVRVNEQERDLKNTADLPHEPFRLTGVDLRENKQVRVAGLAHFKECRNLRLLWLDSTEVSDDGLVYFKNCKNLTNLALAYTQVSDAGLAHFKECNNLMWLDLAGTHVSDAGLAHFKECTNLTALGLGNTQVRDAGLAHFKECKNLTELWLGGTQVTDAGLAHFKERKNLTRLNLSGTNVSDAGLAHFKDCKNLTGLWLGYTPVGGTPVSDAGLVHFKDCKDLAGLFLSGTNVSDAGLAPFKDCKNLTQLTLQKTKVTAAGIDGLKQALPQCKIEWDGGVTKPQ